MMTFETYLPSAPLRPYVKAFHVIESHGVPLENRILPSTSLALSFRFAGQVAHRHNGHPTTVLPAALAGLRQSARLIHYAPHSGTVVTLLREGMAAAWVQAPLHETQGLTLGLDSFFAASEIARVEEQLGAAPNHRARVAVVEGFLLGKLQLHEPDQLVLRAVEVIRQADGRLSMAQLTNRMCLSPDAFEKRFRKAVGMLPKPFAGIVRLHALIKRYDPRQPLQRMALDGDYFDQAHFNRAFKRFTGLPPREFFSQTRAW